MNVTVADCLKLPTLREAQLIAGAKGTDRAVSSVSVLEWPETNLLASCLLPIRKLKDTADGDILIETLCTYLLDAESNTQSTGDLLYIHKNTVHYRLNKIRSVFKCDLVQMPATLTIYKAAVIYRILKGL